MVKFTPSALPTLSLKKPVSSARAKPFTTPSRAGFEAIATKHAAEAHSLKTRAVEKAGKSESLRVEALSARDKGALVLRKAKEKTTVLQKTAAEMMAEYNDIKMTFDATHDWLKQMAQTGKVAGEKGVEATKAVTAESRKRMEKALAQ